MKFFIRNEFITREEFWSRVALLQDQHYVSTENLQDLYSPEVFQIPF